MADILSVWFLTWLVCCSDEFPGILVVHRLGILFRDAQLVADLEEFQILLTVDIGDIMSQAFLILDLQIFIVTHIVRHVGLDVFLA